MVIAITRQVLEKNEFENVMKLHLIYNNYVLNAYSLLTFATIYFRKIGFLGIWHWVNHHKNLQSHYTNIWPEHCKWLKSSIHMRNNNKNGLDNFSITKDQQLTLISRDKSFLKFGHLTLDRLSNIPSIWLNTTNDTSFQCT